jgi:hypothetical protein
MWKSLVWLGANHGSLCLVRKVLKKRTGELRLVRSPRSDTWGVVVGVVVVISDCVCVCVCVCVCACVCVCVVVIVVVVDIHGTGTGWHMPWHSLRVGSWHDYI